MWRFLRVLDRITGVVVELHERLPVWEFTTVALLSLSVYGLAAGLSSIVNAHAPNWTYRNDADSVSEQRLIQWWDVNTKEIPDDNRSGMVSRDVVTR